LNAMKRFLRGQWIYLCHVAGLILPGLEPPVHLAHQTEPAALDGWGDDELNLMIDEGRRQADRQTKDFDRIATRAQWLFTLGAAMIVALAGRFSAADPGGPAQHVFWLVGLGLLTLGVAGAAALMATRADFREIDTAVFSRYPAPRNRLLARDFSRMLRTGENTVATRTTIYRQAVVYVLLGGYTALLAYIVSN
jgi:hypothetical protein